ncbi:MAG: zinc-ribbon domain-containing protein [Terriglobia bacterium]
MAFCSKCGSQVDSGSAFCKSCGAPMGAASGTTASPGPAIAVGSTPMASNVAGLLTYVLGFITGIIFLVIEPYKRDSFVRFHAFQSIFYCAACIVIWIAWGIVSSVLFFGSLGVLWHVVLLSWIVLRVAMFLVWLFLLYKAYNYERYMLPFIGPLAAKQAG